jgi:methionyl-tRNA formyltransferase
MTIVVLCASRRGAAFLLKLLELAPQCRLIVFSFRETTEEPPFLDEIRAITSAAGGVFHEARQVGAPAWLEFWQTTPVDLMFVVGWRYLIPPQIYQRALRGCFVFHDSLLPRYRGFSPAVWAMINGENETGVTLFQIAAAVDSGPIVDQKSVPIGPEDSIADLRATLTGAYLELLERNLPALINGRYSLQPQDHSKATYAYKRLPEDNRIDWSAPTTCVYNLIRAVSSPYSGAFTSFGGRTLRIWAAQKLATIPCYVGRVPGRVVEVRRDGGSVVLTGEGALLITRVQWEDQAVVLASEILNRIGQTMRCRNSKSAHLRVRGLTSAR